MKKYILYTDTNSGNKLKAIKNIAKKIEGLEIPLVKKFPEPNIKEHILMTKKDVEVGAINRSYRPSVELQIPNGAWQIGIQKGFYKNAEGVYFLIHAVALSIPVNEKITERLKASKEFTSPVPLYEQLTERSEIKWYESTIEQAISQLLKQKSVNQKAIHS
jgi:non-canonical (house-cleaning) NTP pyrophosphatase